jgi:hypothetical protein
MAHHVHVLKDFIKGKVIISVEPTPALFLSFTYLLLVIPGEYRNISRAYSSFVIRDLLVSYQ